MYKNGKNRFGFAMIEFLISFGIICALLATIFAITGFISIYGRALIMTKVYVVRPIIVNGGLTEHVMNTIGINGTPGPNSFISKMETQGFTDIDVKLEAFGNDGQSYIVNTQGRVQLRTSVRITLKCNYNLLWKNVDLRTRALRIPIKIVSNGKTEYFWPDDPTMPFVLP